MKKINIKENLSKLEAIADWFEKQKDIDVEAGLEKVKEGALLIRELKGRISEVENEFKEIKKDIEN